MGIDEAGELRSDFLLLRSFPSFTKSVASPYRKDSGDMGLEGDP